MITMNPLLKVKIIRDVDVSMYPFTDFFKGFEKVKAVQQLFGEKTDEVLSTLKIEFSGRRGYMGVSNIDGHIIISAFYLNNGDLVDIYLDIIHELVHVKQFMDGVELFDRHYTYVDRPTEIEAFAHTVLEARNLGLTDARILDYLRTEWMTDEDLKRLAKKLKVSLNTLKD
jgi:hypothetical protein